MVDNKTDEKGNSESISSEKEKKSKSLSIENVLNRKPNNPFNNTESSIKSLSSGNSSVTSKLNLSNKNLDKTKENEGNAEEKSTIEVLSKIYKVLSQINLTTNQIAKDTTVLTKNQTQQDIALDLQSENARARQNEITGQTNSSPVYQAASSRKKAAEAEEDNTSILDSIKDWFTGGGKKGTNKKTAKKSPSGADKLKKKGGLDSIKDAFSGWGKKETEKGTAKKIEKAENKGMLDKLKDAFTGPKAKKIAGGAAIGGAALGIEEELRAQGITDPYAIEAFKAKSIAESGGKGGEEGDWTHTKNSDIRKIFPQFSSKSDEELNDLKSKGNEAFLNKAYKDGGYKYRGRGLIQLTGKTNYAAADRDLGLNGELVNNPDILSTDKELDKKVSVWYYKRGLGKHKDFSSQEDANKRAIEIVGGKNYAPDTDRGKRELNKINKIQQSGKTKELVKNFTEETPKTPKDNITSTPGFSNVEYNPDTETASPFIHTAYNPDSEPVGTFSGAQFPNNESKPKKSTQTELKPLGYTLSDDHEGGKNKIDIQTRKKTKATPEEIKQFYGGGPVLSDEELKQKYKDNPNFSTDDLRKTSAESEDNSKYSYYKDSNGKNVKENMETGEETSADDESGKLDAPKFMIREDKIANGETTNWKVDLESGEETLATEDDIKQDKQQKELEKQYVEKQQASSTSISPPEAKTDPLSYTVETPGENSKVTTTKGSSSKSPTGFMNASETTTVTTTGGGSTLHVQEQSEEEKAKLAKETTEENEKYDRRGSDAAYDPYENAKSNTTQLKRTKLDHPLKPKEQEVLDIDSKRVDLLNERKSLTKNAPGGAEKPKSEEELDRLSKVDAELKELKGQRDKLVSSKEFQDSVGKGGKSRGDGGGEQQRPSRPKGGGGGKPRPKQSDDPTIKMMEEGISIHHTTGIEA